MAEDEDTTAVKLKIHYTFDTEHKANHLCRPPQSFHVHTADFNGPIGVVDLKSCLDLVTNSSPELTNFNELDYTVYSYDVSEEDSPLMGHGLLSKLVAEQDPSNENETMITGKIVQNLLAKFKKNAEPFLEVKLKLTPLSAAFQRQRSGSVSSNLDAGIPQWQTTLSQPASMIDRPQSPADMTKLDNVRRMLAEGRRVDNSQTLGPWHPSSRPNSRPGTPTQYQPYATVLPAPAHPMQAPTYMHQPPMHERRGSESGYWTADEAFDDGPARKRAKTTKVQRATKDTFNIGNQPNSLRTAAMGASSLRMHQPTPMNPGAALQRGMSTEEPVRPPTPIPQARNRLQNKKSQSRSHNMELAEPSSPLQQPTAQHLAFSSASSPEEVRERPRPRSATNTPMEMPSSPPVMIHHPTSPGLPSPPVLHQMLPQGEQHDSGYFSGPVDMIHPSIEQSKDLFNDFEMNSNFADMDFSNFVHDSFEMDVMLQSPADTPQAAQNHYTPVFDEESSYEGPTPQPDAIQPEVIATLPESQPQTIPTPTLMQTHASTGQQVRRDGTFQRPILPAQAFMPQTGASQRSSCGPPAPFPWSRTTAPPKTRPLRAIQRTQSVLPPVPASDPGSRQYKRSNTWTAEMGDVPMSDITTTDEGKSRVRKRVGKEQNQARLESAIATGTLPPFCFNCGVIETPAWRRCFIRTFDNTVFPYDNHDTSLEAGEMCYKAPQETTDSGEIKTWIGWRVEKKADAPDSDKWHHVNLCNPCGLWFHKTKVPRPQEKWQKKEPKREKKRKRPPKPPKSRTQPKRSAAGTHNSDMPESDAQEPGSEESSPADTSAEDGMDDNNDSMTVDGDGHGNEQQEPELPPMPKSTTAHIGRRNMLFSPGDTRQVKSSPLARGNSPLPVNDTFTPNKPLCRLLFPSPGSNVDRSGSGPLIERTNEQRLPSFVRRSPRLNKIRDVFTGDAGISSIVAADGMVEVFEKENVTPRVHSSFIDLQDDLFGDNDDDGMPPPPMTPTPKRRSERLQSRTPQTCQPKSREFGASISGNARPVNKSPKTPGQKQDLLAELFLDTATRQLDPSKMTPCTRRMVAAISADVTPSSRQSSTRTGFTPNLNSIKSKTGSAFDFPNLPSLEGSSPSRGGLGDLFSDMPTERMYSEVDTMIATDAPIPSSPPLHGDIWDEGMKLMEFDQFESTDWSWFENGEKLQTPKKQNGGHLSVTTPGRSALRRSPRKAGQH